MLLFILAAFLAPQAHSAPNVVIIDICSARADRFGAYGYKGNATPQLDAFAKESAIFENAMAQGSWCLTNNAALLTGMPPEAHGLYALAPRTLPSTLPTLAEKLKDAGYATAAYSGGSWLLPAWGLARGFDQYVNTLSTSGILTAFSQRKPEMLDWIRENQLHPFFLYATIEDMHIPYEVELTLKKQIDSDQVVLGSANRVPLLRGKQRPKAPTRKTSSSPVAADPILSAKYDASLSRVDREVSAFLDNLKSMGLWENTVVIVTGDHGEGLGEHGLRGHMEGLYQPILHVPLIVHHPRLPKARARRIPELTERIDLTATVLEIAGASSMKLPGRSLLPLLRGESVPWRKYAFAASKRSTHVAKDFLIDERVVRTLDWKLHWYAHKGRFELYHLKSDPLELVDLSKKRPEILAELTFALFKQTEADRQLSLPQSIPNNGTTLPPHPY